MWKGEIKIPLSCVQNNASNHRQESYCIFFIEIDENCFCTLNLKYQLAPTYANGSLIKTEC